MFLTLNSLYFSLLSLIFTFSLTEGLCSIEPIYLLFCQLYTGDLPYPFISFCLIQCRYQIPSFCPYVTPASVGNQPPHRRSLSSIVRQPENGIYLTYLVDPQSLERIRQSRIIVRHRIESVSRYRERSRILLPFFLLPLGGS